VEVCLPVFTFLFIAAFVLLLVLYGQGVRRRQLSSFGQLMPSIGLTMLGPQHASGRFGRGTLDVILTTERRGSGKNSRTVSVTRYRVRPPTPFRMALKLSGQSAFFGDLADALGLVNDIKVGRADVDAALRIGAADAQHAAQILTQDDVAHAALAAARLGRFYLRDDHAFAQHDGWVEDRGALEQYIHPLGALVDALSSARERIRASWEQGVDRSWGHVAEAEGYRYAATWTAMSSTTPGGATADLHVEASDHGLVTAARVVVPRPLGYGIEVYRTGVLQSLGKVFGAQDITIGVPAIDEPYTIKASREAEARQLLAGMAPDLSTLTEAFGTLRIVDGGLEASQPGLLLEPMQLTKVLRALVRVAQALGGEATQSMGAFR
jgi:hypothetical protein